MKSLNIVILTTVIAAVGFFSFNWADDNNNTTETDESTIVTDSSAFGEPAQFEDYTVGSGITTGNLQVFLIHGAEQLGTKNYTTLATAMDHKLVTVQETGSVNELSIDNNSDQYVFIHSGDIVKGGKQDRTMAYDVIIPPHTNNVPLQSFCVEHGRWQGREDEAVGEFSTTNNMLSSKELKMAAKYDNDQSKVWDNVATEQGKLTENVSKMNGYSVDVKSDVSATSLQLTLENEELKKAKKEMEEALKGILDKYPDAIGYAYAINGEIYGVDIYNNRSLFEEIWPKIVESIAIEAISNNTDETHTDAIAANVVELSYQKIRPNEASGRAFSQKKNHLNLSP